MLAMLGLRSKDVAVVVPGAAEWSCSLAGLIWLSSAMLSVESAPDWFAHFFFLSARGSYSRANYCVLVGLVSLGLIWRIWAVSQQVLTIFTFSDYLVQDLDFFTKIAFFHFSARKK